MKNLLIALSLIATSGCSIILPISHDPVAFDELISIKISISKMQCDSKEWNQTLNQIEHLKVYTQLREDPQSNSLVKLEEGLTKAKNSTNPTFCESVLKIEKTRIDVIFDAWRKR